MSKFKIAVLAIFSVSIVVGLVLFALAKGGSSSTTSANLLVWGTINQDAFDAAYNASLIKSNKAIQVQYVRKNTADFEQDFVEALADGTGPDLVIMREDMLYQNRNKIYTIPYKSYPARDFKDKYIEESELYLASDGVMALPLMVDPLVMYWNRDMFSNNQIAQPPKYWDEIYSMINKMTKRDSNANILQSTIALGEWRNILNAKEILAMILMQAGTTITARQNDKVVSVLNSAFNQPIAPSQAAVNFYTQFSNPTNAMYTWNRSLPSSLNMFLAGNSATYIGFSSEIFGIQQKNSNLNFDVTYVPQIRNSPKRIVFGHIYGISIVKQSKQIPGAYAFMVGLTEPASMKALEKITTLPPVRRDLLADKPTDSPFRSVFYDSALISQSWLDPDPVATSNTFRDMIESITGGKARTLEALDRAEAELISQLK